VKDHKKFLLAMTMLAEVFDKEVTDALREIYWKALEPFDDAQAEKAFNAAACTLKFFPKPVELIELLEGSVRERALIQADEVLEAVRSFGYIGNPHFSDPVTEGIINGGYGSIYGCIKTNGKVRSIKIIVN